MIFKAQISAHYVELTFFGQARFAFARSGGRIWIPPPERSLQAAAA